MRTGGKPNIGAVKTGFEYTVHANKEQTDRFSYRSLTTIGARSRFCCIWQAFVQ